MKDIDGQLYLWDLKGEDNLIISERKHIYIESGSDLLKRELDNEKQEGQKRQEKQE